MSDLTNEQREAVDLVLGLAARGPRAPGAPPPLACLTGGPGTGKTTTLKALLGDLRARGMSAACAAPSGKAAQRMQEATGEPASTLHRLLKLQPGGSDFAPVERDVLVVDEASMVDTDLCAATVAAAAAGTVRAILLVGDSDQIPPVGPGQPFHDILAGGRAPTVRLTEVHRQAATSPIVQAAYSVVGGREPEFGGDFELVEVPDAADIPAAVWELLESHRLDPSSSQILSAKRPGACGVEALNAHVEASRWPNGPELLRGAFRAGTKVIQLANNYDAGVFNGELGTVLEATAGQTARLDELRVEIAGEVKRYAGAQIRELAPAWALTVHKSQGSEWADVIVVAHTSQRYMLTRRLLYVAITRARGRVWVVGERDAVARAVANKRDAKRDTWLGRRFDRDAAKLAAQLEAVPS